MKSEKLKELKVLVEKNIAALGLTDVSIEVKKNSLHLVDFYLVVRLQEVQKKSYFAVSHVYRSLLKNKEENIEKISSEYPVDAARFILLCISEILIVNSLEKTVEE